MASIPSRAVATTRNSPSFASPPPKTLASTRRINALSSATRTVGRCDGSDDVDIGSHGPDLYATVFDVEPHAAAALPADGLPNDGNGRRAERAAARHDVALSHL